YLSVTCREGRGELAGSRGRHGPGGVGEGSDRDGRGVSVTSVLTCGGGAVPGDRRARRRDAGGAAPGSGRGRERCDAERRRERVRARSRRISYGAEHAPPPSPPRPDALQRRGDP